MDITIVFVTIVESFETDSIAKVKPCNLERRTSSRHGSTKRALEIRDDLVALTAYLTDNRPDYINLSILTMESKMNDFERDKMDASINTVLRTCATLIQNLRTQVEKSSRSNMPRQVIDHQFLVIDGLENYLKRVQKYYRQLHTLRLRRAVEFKKASHLASLIKLTNAIDRQGDSSRAASVVPLDRRKGPSNVSLLPNLDVNYPGRGTVVSNAAKLPNKSMLKTSLDVDLVRNDDGWGSLDWEDVDSDLGDTMVDDGQTPPTSTSRSSVVANDVTAVDGQHTIVRHRKAKLPANLKTDSSGVTTSHSVHFEDESSMMYNEKMGSTLNSGEMAQLLVENDQLFAQMNCMVDEVRQLEGRVAEISKLQNVFLEKVLEQDVAVDSIHIASVNSSENVKSANDLIREAMKNQAGFRVWILFFLIVMTFSLMFLDWYNP